MVDQVTTDDTISITVRRLREAQCLTLEQLSTALAVYGHHMSVKTLSKAENGLRRWLAADLQPLADALGVTVPTLLDEREADRAAFRLKLLWECAGLAAQVESLRDSVNDMLGVDQ